MLPSIFTPVLQNGASFLGNISSILQQQEQAISRALAAPRNGPSRGLLQVHFDGVAALLSCMQDAFMPRHSLGLQVCQ